ncbi:MAG TPA: PIN domain-containing protein [Vicinamibacterales bacterium]|jgi:predicted nucleic acid-binding protein
MIVVDTSVWVAALRSASSLEASTFAALVDSDDVLLTAPVRTELLGGARAADRKLLKRLLTALPVAYPTDETWRLMDGWAALARDRGDRFGVGDLLIAAIAKQAGALVWSLDADFARMERLKFVALYEPLPD